MRNLLRVLGALAVVAPLSVLATPTPTSGTLNATTSTTLTFTGAFNASDPTGFSCNTPNNGTCDEYTLTVALPSDYAVTHPNAKVRVSMAFDDNDYDLAVLDADTFDTVAESATEANNPEVAEFAAGSGSRAYLVDVWPFDSRIGGGTYTTTITLIPGSSLSDTDGDGVDDANDDCPGTPPGTTVDADGCPLPDSDGDGVDDTVDACPGTAPGTPVDATGCALPDADGDGVPDGDDACAGTPDGTPVDGMGCPIDPNDPRCTSPGPGVMTDAAGDQTGNPDTDIVTLSISETLTSQRNLVFTVKMASLAELTANARRIITFKKGGTDYYVAMINDASSPTPVFVYGTGINGFGGTDKLGDGAAGSGYTTDGTFTVVVPISAFGLAPGDTIGTFAGVVRLSGGSCTAACVNGPAADTATAAASSTYTLTSAEASCPGPADSDGDGVLDAVDNCPDTPAGTAVDAEGCPMVAGDTETCAVPGLTLLTDAADDNTSGPSGPAAPPGTDLLSLQISQPAQDPVGDNIDDQLLVFRLNIDAGAVPTSATIWFASFQSPAGLKGVRMTGDASGNPVFETYTVGADNSGGTDGRFSTGASPAHSLSTFDSATGAITIWARATAFGFTSPGEKLSQFNAGVMEQAGGVVAFGGTDGMPNNDLSRSTVSYTLHDNTICGGPQLKPPGPPLPASGATPRFYDLQSPVGRADHAGEPTVGYNPFTNAVMFIAGTEVDRVTYAEHSAARDAAGNVLPESCPALWEDKSYAGAVNTLDPILETEQTTGRTFQSSLSGANSIFAFSDDDGDTWIPGQAGPPNGGADHQTVGVGPWAPGAKPASATEDYAIYYCSQSIAAAFCSRSETGGVSFGPGIPFRDTLTDCNNTIGGLHGHVQVARNDGTVYVPFGNCGDKVGVAVSTDSGVNWTVKVAEPTSAGDDPGLGIADDGTAYLCYAAGDKGKPYVTVSRDRGDTWTEPYDLGATLGITHAVFTTTVAGDGDRAACGFLATTSTDTTDPGSLEYPGVWYAYVAMTYDRGQSWHLVNASGGDPVQGAGGICTNGTTCGSNRNLLDFNDVIKSDQGRLLFGYADGCRGACIVDPANPAKNGLADNGVIARQSGGRTLHAALDDAAGTQFNSGDAIAPAAACARAELSYRTANLGHVEWNGGDTGGSPITNYKVYRAESATGPWTFLGDSFGLTRYDDVTLLESVEKYFYKVVAENVKGVAMDSNVIELPIVLVPPGNTCEVPGITVGFESAPGDCTGTGGGCTPQTDIQRVMMAEPPDRPDDVVMTIKVADLNPTPAPGNYWFFLTKKTSGQNLYFSMDTSQGAPRYAYGTYEVGTVTSFTEQGTITGAYEIDGQIHLYAPKALFGTPALQVGDSIVGIDIRTRSGVSAGTSRDTIVGDDYVLRGTEVCLVDPDIEPPVVIAELAASVLTGKAPLDVTFTISGEPSTDKQLASYSLTFGDEQGAGAPAYVGSFGGQDSVQVTHRYLDAGTFRARLSVTDTGGYASSNTAEKTLEVTPADPKAETPPLQAQANNRLGGSMGGFGLLVLALTGLARRVRGRFALRGLAVAALCFSSAAHAVPERLSSDQKDALARLRSATGSALHHNSMSNRAYTMLRAGSGRTLMADNPSLDPAHRAHFFLSVYGAALGVSRPGDQLLPGRISTDAAGNSHVHLDQRHDGLPVFGARLVVHMNRAGITGVSGVFVPGLEGLSSAPKMDQAALRSNALAYAAKFNPGRALRVEDGQWLVYPIGLLQGRLGASRLAYEAIVTAKSGADVRDRVFVDANTGRMLNRINEINTVLNREIYTPDMSGPPVMDDSPTSLIPAGPTDPPLINDPGHNSTDFSTRPGNSPQANLWIFAGGTYALYNNMFGRGGYDACDGFGPCQPNLAAPDWSPVRPATVVGQIQKSVYLINDACPNAYWNGSSTNYCPGFDADDVVSHEWSHAYTQYTHGLIYQYQSGALNESWSDIFGETYDLVNDIEGQLGSTLEEHKYWVEGGSRWVVGEDLSEEASAALLRDMWQPDDFCGTALCARNPGKATSGNYTCGSGDNGGVHANSSVSNHCYAMLVDGTAGQGEGAGGNSYNGQSFVGIGMVKAAHIYFHAQTNYQTPTTDFPIHADALRSSCQDLKNAAVNLKDPTGALSGQVITQADCDILEKAILATELDLGAPCPFQPVLLQNPPAVCGGANDIFTEDWETLDDGWTKTSTGVFAEWEDGTRNLRDFTLASSLPSSRPGTAAFARNPPIGAPGGGDCSPGTGDYSGQYTFDSGNITIPAGASDLKLRFDHYVATEATFDGGQIEISVDGGAFALVPQANYVFNKPNSSLDDPPPVGLNTNPNAGEFAWHGADINAPSGSPPGSWGTTIVDLTGLAVPGNTVKLRLTYSQDGCNGVDGWYVDDIQLYSCPSLEAPTVTLADYEDPDTDGTFTLDWVRPFGATGPDLVQVSEVCGPLMTEDAEDGLGRWTVVRSDPAISPNWESSVAQPNHSSTTFWANPTSEQETQGSSASLTYSQGIAIPADGETFLRFSEWYFNEQDDHGYVQVSANNGPWTDAYVNTRNGGTEAGADALAAEDLVPVEVDLTPYAGQSIRLRFLFELGPSNFFVETQYGWFIDDISVVNDNWGDLTTTAGMTHTLTNQLNGERCYRVRTAYDVGGTVIPSKFSPAVNVTVDVNLPPIAIAEGPDEVTEGEAGELTGGTSSDPNDDAITFAWTQISGPDVTLTGANTATASFTAPDVCTDMPLVFRLTVTDAGGLSATDDIMIVAANINTPPAVSAGADFDINEGRSTLLNADVDDPDCETLTYSWAQVGGPAVTLSSTSVASPTFTAPQVDADTTLVFRLTATDGAGESNTDDIIVTVVDVPPPPEQPDIGNNSAGSLGWLTLMGLGLGGLMRRRRRG